MVKLNSMNENLWKSFQFIDYLNIKKNKISKLPNGVSISTMCANCSLCTNLNLHNIRDYLPLCNNDILTVKLNPDNLRTLIRNKKSKRNTKKTTKKSVPFYNQVTVVVRIFEGDTDDLGEEKKLNLKLFRNGTIQISGLRNIEYANRAINKLIYRLGQVMGRMIDSKIEDIKFIEEKDNLTINNFKIYMINSNYRVNIQIDRSKLYKLLIKKKIKASYEKCIRACVIVKFTPKRNNDEDKEVSIFIFEKGNIIITGARNIYHIIDSYKYMNDIILTHCDEINKIDEETETKYILDLYNELMNENNHKLADLL
jgi:TATA-box binding protein (TBP) (component of TFIID and TFIIIB)